MKTYMYRFILLVLSTVLLFSFTVSATAGEIVPYADSVFDSATISLMTTKTAAFDATTYEIKGSIYVSSCWLEKYEGGGWISLGSLTSPSKVNTNTFGYSASMNYSANIGTGTYRIKATFNADGYIIVRYSNTRTY